MTTAVGLLWFLVGVVGSLGVVMWAHRWPHICLVLAACGFANAADGPIPDDGIDDTAALQTAIDELGARGGGELHIPTGQFDLTLPLHLPDNVQIVGQGYASHLRNTREMSKIPGDQRVIDLGNHTSASLLAEPSHAVQDVVAGAATIVANPAQFPVGSLIFISSTRMAGKIPWYNEFNEVVEVESGALRLKYPIGYSGRAVVRNPIGTQTDPLGRLRRVTRRVGVRNLRISTSGNDWWHSAGGCFEADLSDLWIDARAALVVNGFARCRLNGIRGSFDDRAIEFGIGSHDSQLWDLDLWHASRGNSTDAEPLVAFGEGSRSLTVRDFVINGGNHAGAYGVRFLMCRDCTIRDGTITTTNLSRGAQVAFAASTGYCIRNKIERVDFRGNNGTFALFDCGVDVVSEDNLASSCRFFGTARRAVHILNGTRNRVTSCYFKSGSNRIAPEARNSEIVP